MADVERLPVQVQRQHRPRVKGVDQARTPASLDHIAACFAADPLLTPDQA